MTMSDRPVTLITGTRKGIGRHLAEHYASRGHHVVGCSRSPSGWSQEGYEHFCLDVSDEPAVRALMTRLRREYGRLDHLINNAGIATMNHSQLTPMSTVRSVFETNVFGTFLFCREAAKLMMPRRQGRIVNMSTVATPLKLEGEAVYASSKAAVLSLTEILARELAPWRITVNAVGPAGVDTDMIRGVPAEKIEHLLARQAIHRLATPEDVANVIDFYLRPESDFITGQNLYLGGV
jgi:3-oxoacyl-[acyl-carrier protein] reductase